MLGTGSNSCYPSCCFPLSLSLCLSFSLFAPWLSCTCPCIHGRPRDVYLSSAPDIDCGHALALGKRKRPQESRSLTASRNKRSRHGRREGQQYQHEARVVNGKATLAFAALLLSSLGFHVGGDVASNHCRSCVIMKPGADAASSQVMSSVSTVPKTSQ